MEGAVPKLSMDDLPDNPHGALRVRTRDPCSARVESEVQESEAEVPKATRLAEEVSGMGAQLQGPEYQSGAQTPIHVESCLVSAFSWPGQWAPSTHPRFPGSQDEHPRTPLILRPAHLAYFVFWKSSSLGVNISAVPWAPELGSALLRCWELGDR